MHSTVCCAMLVLPVIGWNGFGNLTTNNSVQLDNQVSQITVFMTGANVVQQYLTPFQLSARDDRIKDCLRSGNCKN